MENTGPSIPTGRSGPSKPTGRSGPSKRTGRSGPDKRSGKSGPDRRGGKPGPDKRGGKPGQAKKTGKSGPFKHRRRQKEIKFDPEARRAHLRGFTERKQERRAFGLAMQKVKDREDRLSQRKQEKKDELDRIEEAERQKQQLLEDMVETRNFIASGGGVPMKVEEEEEEDNKSIESSSDNDGNSDDGNIRETTITTKTYDDQDTESHWGGHVTVTTSLIQLDGGSDDELEPLEKKRPNVDVEQKYAGKVDRYMEQLKGNLPGKRKASGTKRKGQNGASDMKGMGGAGNLKLAQKALTKAQTKQSRGKTPTDKRKPKKGRR